MYWKEKYFSFNHKESFTVYKNLKNMNYDDKQTLSLVTVSLAVLSCLDFKIK